MKKHSSSDWIKPRDEIEEALRSQVGFLRRSMAAYDAGDFSEAARIATAIFTIVHDGSAKGLLTQLGQRAGLRFTSYAKMTARENLLDDHPLVWTLMGDNRSQNMPKLNHGPVPAHTAQFHTWWEKELIFRAPDGLKMNRRQLTFAMRNQDGGGHVEDRLTDTAYIRFSRTHPNWFTKDAAGNLTPVLPMPHLPTMRHIGFELESTLVDAGLIERA